MSRPMEDDYLFVGPLLVARLAEALPDVPVEHVERSEQVLQADQRPMVIKVMWAGDAPTATDERSRTSNSQMIRQRWLVLLALNNASPLPDARSTAAGPTLSKVHKALHGFTPEGAGRHMQRAAASMAPMFTNTQAICPLGFEITLPL
jgi:hypothetical protein